MPYADKDKQGNAVKIASREYRKRQAEDYKAFFEMIGLPGLINLSDDQVAHLVKLVDEKNSKAALEFAKQCLAGKFESEEQHENRMSEQRLQVKKDNK